jgi:hypothetical protein
MADYTVNPLENFYLDGRAIAIDLSNVAFMETSVKRPHMTVLFRPDGYIQVDLDTVIAEARIWMEHSGMTETRFTLEPWGPRSKLVKGPLEWLGLHLRDTFCRGQKQDRPLHVELHTKPRYKL